MNEPITSEIARRPSVAPSPLQAELDAILGSLAHNRPAASPSEDRELLVEVLAERHGYTESAADATAWGRA